MFAPDPVKTFFGHAQRDDHIHVVTVVLLRRVFQRAQHFRSPGRVAVIHQISHFQCTPVFSQHQMKPRCWVDALPFAHAVHDLIHLTLLVFQAFAGIHVRNVHDGFQRWV